VIDIHSEGYIACMEEVVSKILLDYVAFVPTANNKLVDAVKTVGLENMPQNWLAPNLHHGFGLEMGFFADAGADASGQNDSLHDEVV
jgi:hypothetical protein